MKVNVLNVCSPSPDEQKEIGAALAKIPRQPQFASDFEVSRGRSTLSDTPDFLKMGATAQVSPEVATSNYVRVRREFAGKALFSTVQYSFSQDAKNLVETLVLRLREPKRPDAGFDRGQRIRGRDSSFDAHNEHAGLTH